MSTEHEIIIESSEKAVLDVPRASRDNRIIIPVNKANNKAQVFLSYIYKMDDDDARQDLYDFIDQFLEQDQQSGDADDFHNFAVDLARADEYVLACKVLECGLGLFPKNVDLLADYLQFGVKCNKFDECKKVYKTINRVPRRRWTWRGFAFMVDYLLFLIDRSDSEKIIEAKEKEILSVVADYRKQFPYIEDSYRTEANVYRVLNLPDRETDVLRLALDNVIVAPKCALRYADICFERGMYEEADKAIKRGISDATQTQTSVNEGYIYYLSALCKIAIALKKSDGINLNEEEVREIYSDFNIALSKFSYSKNSYSEVIRTKTNTIINKTGIEVDPEFELLCDCISTVN